MTSSLVGSEMCIRDSTKQHSRFQDGRPGAQPESARPYGLRVPTTGAVSYTHLTLPTICSV
eukprot:295413-Prorocentrum_lima.AAC.1